MSVQEEIDKLRAAWMRTEREFFERFPFDHTTDVCCRGCKYGGSNDYRAMSLKLLRQEAWLAVLLAKQSGDLLALTRARANYAKAVGRDRRGLQ